MRHPTIQAGGRGRRFPQTERLVTDPEDTPWVQAPLATTKYVSSNGLYVPADDGLDGYSQLRVMVPGGVGGPPAIGPGDFGGIAGITPSPFDPTIPVPTILYMHDGDILEREPEPLPDYMAHLRSTRSCHGSVTSVDTYSPYYPMMVVRIGGTSENAWTLQLTIDDIDNSNVPDTLVLIDQYTDEAYNRSHSDARYSGYYVNKGKDYTPTLYVSYNPEHDGGSLRVKYVMLFPGFTTTGKLVGTYRPGKDLIAQVRMTFPSFAVQASADYHFIPNEYGNLPKTLAGYADMESLREIVLYDSTSSNNFCVSDYPLNSMSGVVKVSQPCEYRGFTMYSQDSFLSLDMRTQQPANVGTTRHDFAMIPSSVEVIGLGDEVTSLAIVPHDGGYSISGTLAQARRGNNYPILYDAPFETTALSYPAEYKCLRTASELSEWSNVLELVEEP